MDNNGRHPFARLSGTVMKVRSKWKVEWTPLTPAPHDPPEAAAIQHFRYGTAVKRWIYYDATGAPLCATVRFTIKQKGGNPNKKVILPYTYGHCVWTGHNGQRKDKTGWFFKRLAGPLPLYGLDRLAARPNARVMVCEGENSVDAAIILFPEWVPVTSQGGSNAAKSTDWSPLSSRHVAEWPDADVAGLNYAREVVTMLQAVGASTISIVPIVLSEWPGKWDLADPLPTGVSPERLHELLDAAVAQPNGKVLQHDGISEIDGTSNILAGHNRAIEIHRLSHLSKAEYTAERKKSAHLLQINIGDLDKTVFAEKRRCHDEAQAAHRAKPVPQDGSTQWPFGIISLPDGLYFDAATGGRVWLCGPIEVCGLGRDTSGESWGLLLKWPDADGRVHIWPMPLKLLAMHNGDFEAALIERGLKIDLNPASKARLRDAMNGVTSSLRVCFVDTPGWNYSGDGIATFVLINGEVIGSATEKIILKAMPENAMLQMASAGTFDAWKSDVAAKAAGNPVAAFAICAAFAGPLLEPLGESSGGFHFYGRSKTGKTLAIRMGVSVWGSTKKSGLLRDWRATANALEGAAEECNDGLLALDEIHQAEPKDIMQNAYQLANESGRQRLSRDAVSKKRRTWRNIVLSTGEIDIATVAAKASSTPLSAGAEVRLPSIPIDGQEMWSSLHGEISAEALMLKLQRALPVQHGTAIRPYLSYLTDLLVEDDSFLVTAFTELRQHFINRLPEHADAQVRDVARRCTLIALAGELATKSGCLPWQMGEATAAAEVILGLWIHRRGGTGSTEKIQHVKAVRSYLLEFGLSKFVPLGKDQSNGSVWVERQTDRSVVSRIGWRRSSNGFDEEFLLPRDGWDKMCAASGADPTEVAKTLNRAGHLDSGDGKNLMKHVTLPNIGKTRVYIVKPSIFSDNEVEPITDFAT